MDFLLENLEDVVEILLELIKALFKIVTKKLIPFIFALADQVKDKKDDLKNKAALKRFKEELDIKKEKIKSDLREFNEN